MRPKIIVKVTTSYWHDDRGLHVRKDVNFLRRKSSGIHILTEDCKNIGASEVIPRIVNLDIIPDGVYQLIIYNIEHNRETGHVEDWAYKLIQV